jgi:transcriptional regulator with XRE-family HTH domain
LGKLPTILDDVSHDSALRNLGNLMRELRQTGGMSLTGTAQATGSSKSHLSHVECGRDRPGWELVAFYEERFNADGQLWAAFIEVVTGPRPRQRSGSADANGYPLPGDESTFITDITPDGIIMPPGFRFEKIWRIQNTGTVPWTGRWLRRLGSPAGLGIPSSPLQVQIAATMPGQTVDISVPLRAQSQPGTAEVQRTDTGPCVSCGQVDRLLQPFQRLSEQRPRQARPLTRIYLRFLASCHRKPQIKRIGPRLYPLMTARPCRRSARCCTTAPASTFRP